MIDDLHANGLLIGRLSELVPDTPVLLSSVPSFAEDDFVR